MGKSNMTGALRRGIACALRVLAAFALVASVIAQPASLAWAAKSDQSAKAAKNAQAAQEVESESTVVLPADADADAVDDEKENRVNPQQQPDSSFIYDVSIADLAQADSYMDGQTVQVKGEAVGDIINDEVSADYCWVVVASLNRGMDGNISVCMLKTQAGVIDTLGRYGKTGTTLQVRGTFNLVCKDHAGVTDIHADSVSAFSEGEEKADEFDPTGLYPGLVLTGLGIVLVIVFRIVRERSM